MNNLMKEYRHPVIFYSLATFFPWFFWSIAAYFSHLPNSGALTPLFSSFFGFIGLLSPMLIAFMLIKKDVNLRRDIIERFFNIKSIKPIYLFLTFFLMLGSILLAQAISLLFGYSVSQFKITGHFTFTSGVFPVWFLLVIAPVLEELAWHTYGTDSLRCRFNLFNTSIIFAFYWGIWHIPLSFIKDYYQSNLVSTGWLHSLNFLISIFPFVIIMNWLYYKTKRSILVAIIFHITAGYFNEIFATHPDSKIIQTIILLIFSVFLISKEKGLFFNKEISS